jgi:hypothetical protein
MRLIILLSSAAIVALSVAWMIAHAAVGRSLDSERVIHRSAASRDVKGSIGTSLDVFRRPRDTLDTIPTAFVEKLELLIPPSDRKATGQVRWELSRRARSLQQSTGLALYVVPTTGDWVCLVVSDGPSEVDLVGIKCVPYLTEDVAWVVRNAFHASSRPSTVVFGLIGNDVKEVHVRGNGMQRPAICAENTFFYQSTEQSSEIAKPAELVLKYPGGNARVVPLE